MPLELLVVCLDPVLARTFAQEIARHDPAQIACHLTAPGAAAAWLQRNRADVVVLEHRACDPGALQVLDELRAVAPATRVLMLVDACSDALVVEAVRRGASGCLEQSSERGLWCKAVRAVHAGEGWFGRGTMLRALQSQINTCASAPLRTEAAGLTPRESEILRLIGTGLSNKEIARRLEISPQTVKTHLHRTYVKLQRSGRYKAYLAQPSPPLQPQQAANFGAA